MIQYVKEKCKIFNVFYNNKNTNTINTVIDNKLINEEEKLHTGIITYVDGVDKQRELLDYIINQLLVDFEIYHELFIIHYRNNHYLELIY